MPRQSTAEQCIEVSWRKAIITLAAVAVLGSAGGGGASAAIQSATSPPVSSRDLEALEARSEARLAQERERSEALYASDRDVARLEERIIALQHGFEELAGEMRTQRRERD